MIHDENINNGVDAKLLVYEENASIISDKKINLQNIIKNTFFKNNSDKNSNCILINIEKDSERYSRSVKEFEKISLSNFFHLKATYWKERSTFVNDLNNILQFLKTFNDEISLSPVAINEFSEVDDPNIYIQDGPLACYCSHVRSLIYGYNNFNDYTIIVEDDISITNTENIEKYLPLIPNDWDIICLNSAPKNHNYGDKPYYKFIEDFHSGQFYIVRNTSIETLLKNLYPITDQVDVLTSNLHKILNIYNIVDTVYQRNISTNTQNNLHVIFNSPNYSIVRAHIQTIQNILHEFINKELPFNHVNNTYIMENIMFDVLYSFISNPFELKSSYFIKSQYNNEKEINSDSELQKLRTSIECVIKYSKKGIHLELVSLSLVNNIINTIRSFKKYHNHEKFGCEIKSYNYGSTSHTYILQNRSIILKNYHEKFRWNIKDHDDSETIFEKELDICKKIGNLIGYDKDGKILFIEYLGESLYINFVLPYDWKQQIIDIFYDLTSKNIYYPEFNIKNILNKNSKLHFIDFGLAHILKEDDVVDNNSKNCENFIELLEILQTRFKKTNSVNERLILYNTFINNIKVHKIQKYLNNIF
jgi:hypothetical protein